ncbi:MULTISPECIES: DUF7312 domain-containing protein [Natrialbaceae]|uniref:DUF7312 domain-containing protein n=1 Tax=Natrialbaceae TaxID=1644061 RepID=UPI00207C98C7|nr:hypothetical protein [Natronococcus sp. CG52]
MAGDASGGRRDETDGSQEPLATDRDASNTTEEGWNVTDSDADGRPANSDRIPIDLSSGADGNEEDPEDDADDPYAPEPSSTPIERGDPSLENAAFVVLGALAMILVIVRVVSLPM